MFLPNNFIFAFIVILFTSDFFQQTAALGLKRFHPKNIFKGSSPLNEGATVSMKWFEQKLDHFNILDNRTWQQKFMYSEYYYTANSTKNVFLKIGGEGSLGMGGGEVLSFWAKPAKEYGALLFEVEHRFYGDSQPLSNLSLENLQYLSIQQALEDLANFINSMNQEYQLPSDVKWIVFGSSYAGKLTVWMRQKYPHLVAGAVASSATIDTKFSFDEYYQVVYDDLQLQSQTCADNVQEAFKQLDVYLRNSTTYDYVSKSLLLCDTLKSDFLENPRNLGMFEQALLDDTAATIAQYNKVYGTGDLSLDSLCRIMENETIGSEFDRLGALTAFVANEFGSSCNDFDYEKKLQTLRNVTANNEENSRQWYYQGCTESGFYSQNLLFGTPVNASFFGAICEDAFGFTESFVRKNIEITSYRFGKRNIKDLTNVIQYQGSYDPWYPAGMVETVNKDSPVFFVKGAAHAASLDPDHDEEVPELQAVKKETLRLIGVWLGVNQTTVL